MLRLENISKTFNHHGTLINVLEGIDLDLDPGDSLAIMGSSGTGKSTLLNIMGSLEPPTKGTVHFEGANIYEMNEKSLLRLRNQKIGFIFQFHHLLPELNTLENIIMPALIARIPKKKAIINAKKILERIGLKDRFYHRPGELSGGEQQRVAIARALMMRPKLILADEPTGNLDWRTGKTVIDLLLQFILEDSISMVIVTHNQKLAAVTSRQMELVSGHIK